MGVTTHNATRFQTKAISFSRTAIATVLVAVLVGACSNAESANLESLGLAVAADVQAGEPFEVTAAKDAGISITSVSAPSGVTAVVSEPDEETVTLAVEVDPETPAGTYAHSPDRNWENSSEMTDEQRAFGCKDIAQQLIDMDHGDGIDVILGGGRAQFYPDTTTDPEYSDKTFLARFMSEKVSRVESITHQSICGSIYIAGKLGMTMNLTSCSCLL